MSTARSCRPGCRSRGRSGASIPTGARCRATTRSPPTRRRAGRCCACRIGRATSTTARPRLPFLRALLHQLRATLGGGYPLEFRMDGAFFRREILALLAPRRGGVRDQGPLLPVGRPQGPGAAAPAAGPASAATVSCAEHDVDIAPWGQRHRVVVYRTHVQHETAKNFQLDLFDPSDGHYEYSAVVTNKALGGPALWAFMCGPRHPREGVRGAQERLRLRLRALDAVRGQQRLAAS